MALKSLIPQAARDELINSLEPPLRQDVPYFTRMGAFAVAITIVFYSIYPIIYLLSLLLTLVLILISPIIYLSYYVMKVCTYPYHFLGKFETLYIFVGTAVVVGALIGITLHYLSSFMASMLRLDSQPRERSIKDFSPQGHWPQPSEQIQRRDAFRDAVSSNTRLTSGPDLSESLIGWEGLQDNRGRPRSGLIPNTILEEDDSSDDGF